MMQKKKSCSLNIFQKQKMCFLPVAEPNSPLSDPLFFLLLTSDLRGRQQLSVLLQQPSTLEVVLVLAGGWLELDVIDPAQ